MRVPQEILNSIITEVAIIDDPGMPTIKACALASSHFLHGCRRHIFRSLSLALNPTYTGDDSPRASRLYDILERTPDIGNYIGTLFLTADQDSPSMTLTKSDTRLGRLLEKFQGVFYISVRWLNWDEILPSIQQAIFKIMSSPVIGELQMYSVHNLPRDFVRCIQGVRYVQLLGDITFIPDSHSDSLYQFPEEFQSRLFELSMPSRLSEPSLPLIELVSSTSHGLKKLKLDLDVNPSRPGTPVAQIALSKHGNTLKVLELSGMPTRLDLSGMFNLEQLSISPKSVYLDDCVSMEFLTQTLSTVPVNNHLRELEISSYDAHIMALQEGILPFDELQSTAAVPQAGGPPPLPDFEALGAQHGVPVNRLIETFARFMFPPRRGDSPLPHWKHLDEILSSGTMFPKLEKIKFPLVLNSDELKAKLMKRLLPRLHATKGSLVKYC